VKFTIRLRGMNGATKGRTWESADLLRVGRLDPLEVVLEDNSVSRYHAELRATERGWRIRDLGSTNGTRLNGVRLGNGQWPLRMRDLLQFGEVAFVVDLLTDENGKEVSDTALNGTGAAANVNLGSPTSVVVAPVATPRLAAGAAVRTPPRNGPSTPVSAPPAAPRPNLAPPAPAEEAMEVEAITSLTWDEAISNIATDANRNSRATERMKALLRTSRNLVHLEKEEDLLHSVLNDAVSVLDAQRGAIVLLEGPEQTLKLRALVSGRSEPRAILAGRGEGAAGRYHYSHHLAMRCVSQGESLLSHPRADDDPELSMARSIAEGAMASVLCVLLRTPRKRLGVLHLDRSPWQPAFTEDDLRLADALAASVSSGIECAQLLRKQRDLFLNTINILAQAVELRDQYTGNHTTRVTTYSLLLAEHLQMADADVELIRLGTPLHDIGKIGIDDAILRKPAPLTPEEFEQMKKHTVMGSDIIRSVPDLLPILPIVRNHHERWDGKGYPDAQSGADISPLARVVALADAFDAMTSDRPYRKGMAPEVAFAEIEKGKGRQFDPTFATAFLAIRDKVVREMLVQAQSSGTVRRLRVPSA
jgi:putative nucleotidyltransferase with HDIG domain